MAVCTAIPVPQGCSGRCRDRRDRPQRLCRKRSGRNCQCRHGLTALQKGKSAQLRTVVGGSSTGVQHRRGLLLQAQRGGARRRYRPGRRQQLDRPVSGSRVGPDTDHAVIFGLACTQGQGLSGRVRIVLRKGGAVSHDRAPWEDVRGARRLDFLAGFGCRHKRRVSESKTARAATPRHRWEMTFLGLFLPF